MVIINKEAHMKIVIIGGSHAGMMAADEILRCDPDNEIEIYDQNKVSSFATEDIPAYIRGGTLIF